MIKFRGSHPARQYLAQKPIKQGFKAFVIACATTGYVLKIHIYAGKKHYPEHGLTNIIVQDLAQNYLLKFYYIITDSYFSTYQVSSALLRQHTYFIGKIALNRLGIYSRDINVSDEGIGTIKTSPILDSSITGWKCGTGKKPNSVQYFLSTGVDASASAKKQRKDGKNLVEISTPEVASLYYKYFRGVDYMDQAICYYRSDIRSRLKFYNRIFFWLLDVVVFNSYVLYQEVHHNNQMNLLKFRGELIQALVQDQTQHRHKHCFIGFSTRLHERINLEERGTCHMIDCHSRTKLFCEKCQLHICEHHWAVFHKEYFKNHFLDI